MFSQSTQEKVVLEEERMTLYQLIVDVLAEHLNLFKSNPPLDLNSLSLVVKGTLIV